MIWALAYGLGVLGVLAMTARDTSISNKRLAYVLAANFAMYLFGQLITGQAAPWLWFLAVDCVCAFVVLHPPASRTAAVIGCFYVLQIILHVAFAGAGSAATTLLYLDLLATAGWFQLLALATGTFQHGRKRKMAAAGGSSGGAAFTSGAHR